MYILSDAGPLAACMYILSDAGPLAACIHHVFLSGHQILCAKNSSPFWMSQIDMPQFHLHGCREFANWLHSSHGIDHSFSA